MNRKFIDFMADLRACYPNAKIAIAVSGGADSLALMHMCHAAGLDATAITVDHGLRPASAAEAEMVAKFAAKIGMPHATLHWRGHKPKTGLEAAARTARYKLMADYCRANEIEILLTAHQADDQIETFLMNLGRGSGIYGLAAIRPWTARHGIKLARPLLDISRAELVEYCRANKIKFIQDEMNDIEDFTRVRIRKNRACISDKLGISDARILTAIESLGRVRDALESIVEELIENIEWTSASENRKAVFQASFLFDSAEEIRLKLFSRLIQEIGALDYPPRLEKIQAALEKLKSDTILTVGRCAVRRFRDKILIAPEGTSVSFRKSEKKEPS